MNLKRLKYWWYRRKNDHPCPEEVSELMSKTKLKSLRILGVCLDFTMSKSLETTARDFKITRERTRQILWKLYWSVHRVESDLRTSQQVHTPQDVDV